MFDIQKFAEGEIVSENISAENKNGSADNSTTMPEEGKQDSHELDIQAKIDAAVSKVTARLEAEYKKREAEAKKEAERLSKLSDDERQKAELENTRKELEAQRAEFEREKIKYEAAKVLAQRNLPVEFVEYLIAEDNAKTLDRITTFEKRFKKAIEDGVNEKLKGKSPTSGGKSVGVEVSTGGSVNNAKILDIIRRNQIAR